MSAIPTNKKLYDSIVTKVKSQVARWPSAYASGMVVSEYKKAMKKLGKEPYKDVDKSLAKTPAKLLIKPLARWYKEKWIDIKTGKECGKVRTDEYYPTCRPSIRVTKGTPTTANELSQKQKSSMIKQKQKAKKTRVNYKQTKKD